MAAVADSVPDRRHRRRCSSIPRPTSNTTFSGRCVPGSAGKTVQILQTGQRPPAAEKNVPSTVIKPRTYSRTRRGSLVSQKNEAPFFNLSGLQRTRTSLAEATPHPMDGSADTPFAYPNKPMTQVGHSDHVLSSARSPSEQKKGKITKKPSLRSPRGSGNSNTSSTVAKESSPVILQRQLMGPLGPPMPRSQTVGNFAWLTKATESTHPPSKNPRAAGTLSMGGDLDAVGSLSKSKICLDEVEDFPRIAEKRRPNKLKLKANRRIIRGFSGDSEPAPATPKTQLSFVESDGSLHGVYRRFGENAIGDSREELAAQGANLTNKIGSASMSPSILTPTSQVSQPHDQGGLAVNIKFVSKIQQNNPAPIMHCFFSDAFTQVEVAEPVQYWRGRFSTILDRLRAEDYSINLSVSTASTGPGEVGSLPTPRFDGNDSFEVDEIRRTRRALEELHHCCRTRIALRSFQIFAQEVLDRYEKNTESKNRAKTNARSAESSAGLLASVFSPKASARDKNIITATMRIINTERRQQPLMRRSNTIGDLEKISHESVTGSTTEEDTFGGDRRPSCINVQEKALASEMRADQRAKAEATSQRGAGRNSASVEQIGISDTAKTDQMWPNISRTVTKAKPAVRYSLPKESIRATPGTATNAEAIKRVFSEGVRSVRKIGRNFTGTSSSGDG